MASVLTGGFFLPVSLKNSAGRSSQPADRSVRRCLLPAGERVTAVVGHARVAIAISAVTAIIGFTTAIIDRAAAVVDGTAAIVIIVAVVLGRGDRDPGPHNPGERGSRRSATAAAPIVPAAGAEISGVAGRGRGRNNPGPGPGGRRATPRVAQA